MIYWEDMRDKYGFGDGGTVPPGAGKYREVYVKSVNKLAEQLGSDVRAVAYDRPGWHNPCMILFHKLEDLKDTPKFAWHVDVDIQAQEVKPDCQMHRAIDMLNDLEVDEFLNVTVEIDDSFTEFVTALNVNELDQGE